MKAMSQFQPPEFLPPVFDDEVQAVGDFAWDRWEQSALAAGLAPELATLGRAVIREAYQHGWPAPLQEECGWFDSGAQMLRLAQAEPHFAKIRWAYLLESDGDFHWSSWRFTPSPANILDVHSAWLNPDFSRVEHLGPRASDGEE